MRIAEFATVLLETKAKAKGFDTKIEVFLNRLLMRIFSQPSLLTYLNDVGVVPKEDGAEIPEKAEDDDESIIVPAGEEDEEAPAEQEQGETEQKTEKPKSNDKFHGVVTVQLDFHKLPEEAIEPLKKLISSPSEIRLFKFVKKGAAHVGFAFDLSPEDMPGEEFDYAQ